jgi:hypothetical protein
MGYQQYNAMQHWLRRTLVLQQKARHSTTVEGCDATMLK